MTKAPTKLSQPEFNRIESAHESAHKILGDSCACCILISCTKAQDDGKMAVEMHYEGDETLAAFLLENASQMFDAEILKKKSK